MIYITIIIKINKYIYKNINITNIFIQHFLQQIEKLYILYIKIYFYNLFHEILYVQTHNCNMNNNNDYNIFYTNQNN